VQRPCSVPPACRGNLQEGVCTCFPPSLRFPPLREGNRVKRGFGSPCLQGEPASAPLLKVPPAGARGTERRLGSPRCARGTCRRGFRIFSPSVRFPPLTRGEPRVFAPLRAVPPACEGNLQQEVVFLPPSVRFPPLTRGEPREAQSRFPLLSGGTCRRGFGTHPPALRAGEFTVSYKHSTPPTTQAGGAGALRKEARYDESHLLPQTAWGEGAGKRGLTPSTEGEQHL
jgi:hypothetical protein